jgi:hypothetical protein
MWPKRRFDLSPYATLLAALLSPVCFVHLNQSPPKGNAPAPAQPSPQPKIPDDLRRINTESEYGEYVVIDGKTHPELIPEYRAWQTVLFNVATAKQQNGGEWRHIHETLGLSPTDESLLLKAANREYERHHRDDERIQARIADQQSRGEVGNAFDIILAGRILSLDIADELLQALSPEGQASLWQLKNDTVEHLTVYVLAGGWKDYLLPR